MTTPPFDRYASEAPRSPGAPSMLDPATGLPYSDKSKLTVGLLQLVPGVFMGLGGVGRMYAGNRNLGAAQLAATLLGWVSLCCGFFLFAPFFISIACWLWFVIDGIVILTGNPRDGLGRPLRP